MCLVPGFFIQCFQCLVDPVAHGTQIILIQVVILDMKLFPRSFSISEFGFSHVFPVSEAASSGGPCKLGVEWQEDSMGDSVSHHVVHYLVRKRQPVSHSCIDRDFGVRKVLSEISANRSSLSLCQPVNR